MPYATPCRLSHGIRGYGGSYFGIARVFLQYVVDYVAMIRIPGFAFGISWAEHPVAQSVERQASSHPVMFLYLKAKTSCFVP